MRYKLKLKRLDFISAVDEPAQETAKVLLIKRKGSTDGVARVAKVDDELGLVFCWAFTSQVDGADYYDLHNDTVDQDFVKACAEFMEGARAVDEMHDGEQTGRVVFAMPMTPEVAKAFGVTTDTVGLMVAIKPSAEALAKFKDGTYTGVSIAGIGEREAVKRLEPSLTTHDVIAIARNVADERIGSLKSTRSEAPIEPVLTTEKSQMANENEVSLLAKVEELSKKLEHATKLATFSDAQREYYKKLGAEAAETFFAKSYTDRESEVAPVYTSKSDGTVYRKSDDPRLVEMAKRQDRMLLELEKRDDALSRNEIAAIAKSTLDSVGGDDDIHKYIVKAIRNGGGDAGVIDQALTSLRGANEAAKRASIAAGFNPGKEAHADSPEWQVEALAQRYASEHKCDVTKARALIFDTPEGASLYAQIEKRKQAVRS